MRAITSPAETESLGALWAMLHRTASITLSVSEVHYLTSTALAIDDDIVSQLLLRKLRLAKAVAGDLPAGLVRMNSYVEFVHGEDERRFCQLLHPTAARALPYGLSIASLAGAGLIGLQARQTVLWPGADGRLRDLEVVHVENCPGLDRWLGVPG